MTREPHLFAELPDLVGAVPFRPIAELPTPVEPCSAIAPFLGRDRVWIKRDDLVSSRYGGNKVRRFEYILPDAERRGATELVTAGGLASTQVIATVVHGRAHGFAVTAALFDQPVTAFARRALLVAHAQGGRLLHGGSYAGTAIKALSASMRRGTYLILPGASTPIANLGYVDAMLELSEQVRSGDLPRPDLIVLPTGSGGTLAGLTIGVAILGWPTRIVGVRITELLACNRVTLGFLVRATARFLRRRSRKFAARRLPPFAYALHHGAIGGGYGHPTREAIEAIPEVERLVGVPGEVTYSGKGLAGLRTLGRENPNKNILYWQTLSSVEPPIGDTTPADLPRSFHRFFEGDVAL